MSVTASPASSLATTTWHPTRESLPAANQRRSRLETLFAFILLVFATTAFDTVLRPQDTLRGDESDPVIQVVWLCLAVIAVALIFHRAASAATVPRTDGFLVALMGLAVLSVVWSIDPGLTLRRDASLLATIGTGYYLASTFAPTTLLRLIRSACLFGAISSLVWSVVSPAVAYDAFGRFRGVFAQKNALGLVAAIGAMTCVALVLSATHHRWREGFLGAVFVSVLFMSGSRTSLVALIGGVVVVVVAAGIKSERTRTTTVGTCLVAMAGIVAWVVAVGTAAPLRLLGRDQTLTGRTELWHAVEHAIGSKPVAGWGFGGFWSQSHGPSQQLLQSVNWDALSSHEGFLEMALNLGLLGTVSVLVLLLRILARAQVLARSANPTVGLYATAIVGFAIIYNLAEADLFKSRSLLTVLLVIAITLVSITHRSRSRMA